MPRKPAPECILILQDVGKNMSELSSDGVECLKISKDCVMQIMLRKLFNETLDEFGLITFGSQTTNNALAKGNEYRGIDLKTNKVSTVNPEILKEVENLTVNQNGVGDWLDAIIVAIQFISEENKWKAYSELKILIFSNFHNTVNDDQIDIVTQKLKTMGIDLTVIGPDVPANISNGELSSKAHPGEVLIASMIGKLDGTLCSFRDAHTELANLQKKAAKPTPWNSMLHISSKIKIPIRAFKKIAPPKAFKWTAGVIDDERAAVVKEKAYVKFDEATVTDVQVEKDELIDAYLFGTTIVPFSDIDKDSMNYESGPKGLYLIHCTDRKNVEQHMLMGDGSYIVLARQDDEVGNHMLQSFIQAMFENELVGIARRVYSDNTSAYTGVLAPYVNDDSRYLVYVQLPYAEDEHVYRFPSLKKIELTPEELSAVDNLVDAMDLDQIDSEEELYDITQIHDPHEQYMLRCLGHKYVHPKEDIPDELKEDIIRAMQPKPVVIENSKAALLEVAEKFHIEKIVKKTKGRFNREADEPSTSRTSDNNLFQTVDNQSNSNTSASSSIDFQTMQLAVENVIKLTPENTNEFIDALKSIREKCSNNNPHVYNKWIPQIKDMLKEHKLSRLWNALVDENLGLISKTEAPLSDANDEVVAAFLKVDDHDFKNDDDDSMYGSMTTESNDNNWLDDL